MRNLYLQRFWQFQTNSLKNVGGVGFLVIDTWAKWDFEIRPFLWFLEAKVVSLGPIDFQLSLPLNINWNDGQNKFEVHISKNVAKMANFQPKIGQDSTFPPTFNGQNLDILIRFWRSTTPKWLARRDESKADKS